MTIGYDVAGQDGPADVRGLWTMADGRSWNPVGAAQQFPGGENVADMAVVGRRIVAVGSATARPAPNGVDQGSTEDAAAWIGTVLP